VADHTSLPTSFLTDFDACFIIDCFVRRDIRLFLTGIIFFMLQTFHTPSFGDEEFDIPPINPHHQQQQAPNQHPSQGNMASYQQPQMMGSQPSDGMVMNDPSAYQQPLYLTGPPEHSMGISAR
jgi:hypothetical protein